MLLAVSISVCIFEYSDNSWYYGIDFRGYLLVEV